MERLTKRELNKAGCVELVKCDDVNCVHCPSCDYGYRDEAVEKLKEYEDLIEQIKQCGECHELEDVPVPILDKQQLDKIRGMVIHGLYAVTLKNGYDMCVFADMKREQNRLFDNFENNMKLEGKWKD